MYLQNFSLKYDFSQTSQDPSSPLAGPISSVLSVNLNLNAPMAVTTVNDPTRDGWENDEWGSLEEEPANEELEEKANHVNASRSNSNSQSHSSSGVYNNNVTNSLSPTRNNGDGDTMLNSSSNSNSNWDNNGTGWNEDEFEPIDDSTAGKLSNFTVKL